LTIGFETIGTSSITWCQSDMSNTELSNIRECNHNSLRVYFAPVLLGFLLIGQFHLGAISTTPNLSFEINYAQSESSVLENFNLNADLNDYLFTSASLLSRTLSCNGKITLIKVSSNTHVSIPCIRAPPFPY